MASKIGQVAPNWRHFLFHALIPWGPKAFQKRIRDATSIFYRFWIHFGNHFGDILKVAGCFSTFFGTSAARSGAPAGEHSYFATVSKYVPRLRTSFYGSLNYSEWDGSFNFPLGVGIELSKGFSLQPMYDGTRGHAMLNYFTERYGVSLMCIWLDTPGISFSAGF